jgi:hypothetical protein
MSIFQHKALPVKTYLSQVIMSHDDVTCFAAKQNYIYAVLSGKSKNDNVKQD